MVKARIIKVKSTENETTKYKKQSTSNKIKKNKVK